MLVIADTTPLRYLVALGQADLLPTLFGQVIIPLAVAGELQHSQAPAAVRAWIASPPPWLDIRPSSLLPDAVLLRLDPGEREALLLAQELQADLVLVDDQDRSSGFLSDVCSVKVPDILLFHLQTYGCLP